MTLVTLERPKARAKKIGIIHIIIFISLFVENCLYMIIQYGSEPVLMLRILIGFDAILEIFIPCPCHLQKKTIIFMYRNSCWYLIHLFQATYRIIFSDTGIGELNIIETFFLISCWWIINSRHISTFKSIVQIFVHCVIVQPNQDIKTS